MATIIPGVDKRSKHQCYATVQEGVQHHAALFSGYERCTRSAGGSGMKPNDPANLVTIWGVDALTKNSKTYHEQPLDVTAHAQHHPCYIYHHHVGINSTFNCNALIPFLCPCFHP